MVGCPAYPLDFSYFIDIADGRADLKQRNKQSLIWQGNLQLKA